MFIDRVVIEVRSGKGGDGAISFLHDKNTIKGGPNGGNGGRGGSVYLRANKSINTLINYRFSKVIIAKNGENGSNKNKYGKSAEDVYCDVPVGTVIIDEKTKEIIFDLKKDNEIFLIAKGGRGGRGNLCFKSNYNKCPRIAENGHEGTSKRVILELKLLADVGLVGLPSVGKSTLLSLLTKATPQIGDYDFTTITPNLGVCSVNKYDNFVIADLPGLIEGASNGKGLGFTFLRHIERCKILCQVISMEDKIDPIKQFKIIDNELKKYNLLTYNKKRVILASKMDLDEANENFLKLKKYLKSKYEIISFSAYEYNDLTNIKETLFHEINKLQTQENSDNEINLNAYKEYTYKKQENDFEIIKIKNNVFKIVGASVEKTFKLINLKTEEGIMKLIKYLDYIGVEEKLKKLNAKNGDTIILCDFEFEYFE